MDEHDEPRAIFQVGEFAPQEELGSQEEIPTIGSVPVYPVENIDRLDAELQAGDGAVVFVNGTERGLLSLMTAKAKRPLLPVVMLVDLGETELLRRALEHGLDSYVVRAESWEETWSILEVIFRQCLSTSAGPPPPGEQSANRAFKPELQVSSFWSFFEAAPVGIKILDENNFILYANRRLQEMLGYSQHELQLLTERQLIHPDDHSVAHGSFLSLVEGKSDSSDVIVRHLDRDGEAICTALGRVAFRDEQGTLKYVFESVVEHDPVTGEQDGFAEHPLVVSELATGIAHDLRNILTLIALSTQQVREQHGDVGELTHTLDQIIDAAKRGNRIAERVTQLGRPDVPRQPVDLGAYVQDFEVMLPAVLSGSIDLQVRVSEEPVEVYASLAQLDQVILNLVRNSADAMPEGGEVLIEVTQDVVEDERSEARPTLCPGEYVVLRVHDEGVGMEEETRERIFEPYFSTKDSESGVGLGLANVYRVVRELDGSICVDTQPGQGSIFSVYLPLHHADER